jgi:hypothetical protein
MKKIWKRLFGTQEQQLDTPVVMPRFGVSPTPYEINVKSLIKKFIKEYVNLDTYDNDMGGFNWRFFDDLHSTVGLPQNEDNAKLVSECIFEYYSGKNQVENINSSNEKLLLSDVPNSAKDEKFCHGFAPMECIFKDTKFCVTECEHWK